jgi:hypothetical protein
MRKLRLLLLTDGDMQRVEVFRLRQVKTTGVRAVFLELTEAHKWVLSHIAIQQLKNGPYGKTATITAAQLAHIMPDSLLQFVDSEADIVRILYELLQLGALKHFSGSAENACFTVTVNGILLFRKILKPLASAVSENNYGARIENTKGNEQVKNEFKRLRGKLRDKTEDEIIDAFIDLAKKYGHYAVIFLLKLVQS